MQTILAVLRSNSCAPENYSNLKFNKPNSAFSSLKVSSRFYILYIFSCIDVFYATFLELKKMNKLTVR